MPEEKDPIIEEEGGIKPPEDQNELADEAAAEVFESIQDDQGEEAPSDEPTNLFAPPFIEPGASTPLPARSSAETREYPADIWAHRYN